jgi:hypothetical protein
MNLQINITFKTLGDLGQCESLEIVRCLGDQRGKQRTVSDVDPHIQIDLEDSR